MFAIRGSVSTWSKTRIVSSNIERAVAELKAEPWTVGNRDIGLGDRVMIWKAKGNDKVRGILAFGEVVSNPYSAAASDVPHQHYWRIPVASAGTYVDVQYLAGNALPCWLEDMEALRGLTVADAQGGPVFYEEPDTAEAVVNALGGWPDTPPVPTSDLLNIGSVNARKDLADRFGINDATLNTGIFRPKKHRSIWLFVTENKPADRRQYKDYLDGQLLRWQGQNNGRKDRLIVTHEDEELEVLVFYRKEKQEFQNYGFIYKGRFRYVAHQPNEDGPTDFVLQRIAGRRFEAESIESAMADIAEDAPFDPVGMEDQREFVHRQVARRLGQIGFRRELIRAYGGRCAITGCDVSAVLEAAHISPYRGPGTNHVTNGLLLRSDIHLLFDQGLLGVLPGSLTVVVSGSLADTEYAEFEGQTIRVPVGGALPSNAALEAHVKDAGLWSSALRT